MGNGTIYQIRVAHRIKRIIIALKHVSMEMIYLKLITH